MDGSGRSTPYRYSGEKYNAIVISWSDSVAANRDKVERVEELRLDKALVNHLIASRLYDRQSSASIHVDITDLRFRNAFSAIAFGFMSGSDNLDGEVTLVAGDGTQLARFTVSVSYAMGGLAGGVNENRLGWLSGKFAELAINTILNKESVANQARK